RVEGAGGDRAERVGLGLRVAEGVVAARGGYGVARSGGAGLADDPAERVIVAQSLAFVGGAPGGLGRQREAARVELHLRPIAFGVADRFEPAGAVVAE